MATPSTPETKAAPAETAQTTGMSLLTVYGHGSDFKWHVVIRSYPSEMDTACGKTRAFSHYFCVVDPSSLALGRNERCADCDAAVSASLAAVSR